MIMGVALVAANLIRHPSFPGDGIRPSSFEHGFYRGFPSAYWFHTKPSLPIYHVDGTRNVRVPHETILVVPLLVDIGICLLILIVCGFACEIVVRRVKRGREVGLWEFLEQLRSQTDSTD